MSTYTIFPILPTDDDVDCELVGGGCATVRLDGWGWDVGSALLDACGFTPSASSPDPCDYEPYAPGVYTLIES